MYDFSNWADDLAILGVTGLMFSMGLSLTTSDFTRSVRFPTPVIIGLFGQIILLPLVAFTIAKIFGLTDYIALGLMIIAACPGGSTSNAFSFLAKGDVALSITLTAFSSIFAFATIPFVINLSISYIGYGGGDIQLSFVETAMRVFMTTALPVLVGMIVRAMATSIAQKVQKPIFYIALLSILLPSIEILFRYTNIFFGKDLLGSASAIVLNITMICIGFTLGKLTRLPHQQQRTLALEVGIQNYALVEVIVLVFLDDVRLLAPGILYLPTMLITGTALAYFFSRAPNKEADAIAQ